MRVYSNKYLQIVEINKDMRECESKEKIRAKYHVLVVQVS